MRYLPLIWAALVRKSTRTLFTLLSMAIAFLLFGVLQGVNAGFARVIAEEHLDRLLTDPRVPRGAAMPVAARSAIERVAGVIQVAERAAFYGYYQQPKNTVVAIATNVDRFFAVRPEFQISKEHLEALHVARSGMVVTPAVQKLYGWRVGERIPIKSPITRTDGSNVWTFDLIGIMDDPGTPGGMAAVINYSYFDEGRSADRGTVDRFIVRIADPSRSAQTAAAIDRLFANSAHETRTQSEKELAQSQLKQIGDIGFLVNAIIASVFFTLLFLTSHTMIQSVRERFAEFAIMKIVGFSGSSVFMLVLAESLSLSLAAAVLGLGLAAMIFPWVREFFGLTEFSSTVFVTGAGAAMLVGLFSAALPAWQVRQLRVVDALARR